MFNGENRHIRLRHNVVQQLLETRVISLGFVRSELNGFTYMRVEVGTPPIRTSIFSRALMNI